MASALGTERRLVAYHLLALEERGFVTSKYEPPAQPNSTGKTIGIYTATTK